METFLSFSNLFKKNSGKGLSSLGSNHLRLEKLKTHYSFYKDPIIFHERLKQKHTRCPLIPFSIGKKRIWLLNDLNAIKEVLVTKSNAFIRNNKLPKVLGEGLLSSNGKVHQKNRHIIAKVFTKPNIEKYSKSFSWQTNQLMSKWQDQRTVDMEAEMSKLTCRIITQVLFGTSDEDNVCKGNEKIYIAIQNMSAYFSKQSHPLSPFFNVLPLPSNIKYALAFKTIGC